MGTCVITFSWKKSNTCTNVKNYLEKEFKSRGYSKNDNYSLFCRGNGYESITVETGGLKLLFIDRNSVLKVMREHSIFLKYDLEKLVVQDINFKADFLHM